MNTILSRCGGESRAIRTTICGLVAWLAIGSASWSQDELVVKLYPCPAGRADAIAKALHNEFGVIRGVRIAPDERTSQVIVQAPAVVQARISQRLAANGIAGAPALGPAAGTQLQTATVPLRRTPANQVEASLWSMLGNRLASVQQASRSNTREYRLAMSRGGSANITIDVANNQVKLEGETAAVDTLRHLIDVIDAPQEPGDRKVRLVPVHNAQLASVEIAAEAIRHASGADVPSPPVVASMFQARAEVGPPAPGTAPAIPGTPPQGANPSANAQFPVPGGNGQAPVVGQAVQALVGGGINNPVQIEILDQLDLIIIRGNASDVEQVKKIIEQIDDIASKTVPEIRIVPLVHLDCESVATFVKSLYDDAYLARQGAVSITPVVLPNALLVVGRKENVDTVVTLVNRVDQPAAPGAQFQIFHLQHATAATIAASVTTAFAEKPGGLAPVIHVTSDLRSNSVIVQASPRDMQLVADLIQKLDISDFPGGKVNELRIIQLEHTLATDIVSIMQQAGISTGTAPQQGNQQQPQQQGPQNFPGQQGQPGQGFQQQQPQNQQQGNQARQDSRAAMLRFLTIDAKGRTLMSSGILSDVRITADPKSNAVIVESPAENLPLIEALIRQLDSLPAASAQIKVFTVVNGDATQLSDMLRSLFGGQSQQGGGGGQQGGGGFPILQQISASGGETNLVPLRFAVDTRTNSVIASGTAGDLQVVEAILTRLDDGEVRHRKSVVFRLKNSPATDVATALNSFLRAEQQTIQQAGQGLVSPFEQLEREVVVVPEPVSNSLVLSATPRFFDEIKGIIEQLDARPPMVMIQVLIASVELGDTNEFGIELGLQDSVLFDRSILNNLQTTTNTLASGASTSTVVSGVGSPGFNFNNGTDLGNLGNLPAGSGVTQATHPQDIGSQGISNFGTGRTNSTLGYSGLVLSAASQNVSALLRALSEKHRVDILQRPQVMTLDNQPAFIQVGQRVPRITSVTNSAVTGNTNAITLDNVGLILAVTPRISPDGLVVMQIDAEKSELESDATGIPIFTSPTGQVTRSPIIDATTAQTTVAAMSEQTVILGGLITKQKSLEHHGVPVLDDIPIINNFFRYDSVINEKTELLIIMTPHIVRNENDSDTIRRTEAAKMSWCMADVTKIYGEAGLRSRRDEWADSEVPVIYPDSKPTPPAQQIPVPSPTATPPQSETVPTPSGMPLNGPNGAPTSATTPGQGGISQPFPVDPNKQVTVPLDASVQYRYGPPQAGVIPTVAGQGGVRPAEYQQPYGQQSYGPQPANGQQPVYGPQPANYQQQGPQAAPNQLPYQAPYRPSYQPNVQQGYQPNGQVVPANYQGSGDGSAQRADYQAPAGPPQVAPQAGYPSPNGYAQPAVYQQPINGGGTNGAAGYR